MTSTPAGERPLRTSSRRKDTIIAAIATVLAAVIAAGGAIIAAGRRDQQELQKELTSLREQLTQRAKQVQLLETNLAACQKQTGLTAATSSAGTQLGELTPTSSIASNATPSTQSEQGFQITLGKCARSGRKIFCDLKVLNNGTERRFRLMTNPSADDATRAWDTDGTLHKAVRGELAKTADPFNGIDLPSGTPITAGVEFRDIPPEVSKFTVLKIAFRIRWDDHEVEYRDVPIS